MKKWMTLLTALAVITVMVTTIMERTATSNTIMMAMVTPITLPMNTATTLDMNRPKRLLSRCIVAIAATALQKVPITSAILLTKRARSAAYTRDRNCAVKSTATFLEKPSVLVAAKSQAPRPVARRAPQFARSAICMPARLCAANWEQK